MRGSLTIAALSLLLGCPRPPPDAEDQVNDAVVALWLAFDGESDDLAKAMREVEAQVYESMDVDSGSSLDRSLMVARLTDEDVAHLDHPDRPASSALPIAVAASSRFAPQAHQHIQLLGDLTAMEPYSPDLYDRTVLQGQDCWLDHGCTELRTFNELVRDNILITMPYEMYKDFRWVDLAEQGEPRWAFLGRAWQVQSFTGESGASHFYASYIVELWIPRDGRGPLPQSEGGGSLRLWVGWNDTDPGADFSEDQVAGTTRLGMDKTFAAYDDWLEEQGYQPERHD